MIRHRLVLVATLSALLAATPRIALGQASNPPPATAEAAVPAQTPAASAAETPGFRAEPGVSFAERTGAPRTLRAYWHVFIAFAVTWLLLFGYALSLGTRWARLERRLQE